VSRSGCNRRRTLVEAKPSPAAAIGTKVSSSRKEVAFGRSASRRIEPTAAARKNRAKRSPHERMRKRAR